MKISNKVLLFTAALIFFGLIGGFSQHIGWEARLLKLALVSGLVFLTYKLKKSKNARLQKSTLIIVLLMAAGIAYAEPYATDLILGNHHHHVFCLD